MKTKFFEPNILPVSILSGIVGGILLISFMALEKTFHIKGFYGILIYILTMIVPLIIYKRKEKGDINFLKAFVIAFLVFSIITIIGITYSKVINENAIPLSYSIIIFFRLLGIGIASSLIAALFFRNKKQSIA